MSPSDPGQVDEATQVVPTTAAAVSWRAEFSGLTGGDDDAGRVWFDGRLHGFLDALSHDHAGCPRTDVERRALASAARDMVERVGWQGALDSLPTNPALRPEQLLANTYSVRALIARGGAGEIYRTRHRDLRTDHAIKILLPRHTLDTTHVMLMLEEGRILQSVNHDGVVRCQGLLRDADGRLLLVMEYLRGHTLSARLQEGPLSTMELVDLIRRLASALTAIHAQQIVHQDLSPDNIILRNDSCKEATIIDFGVARSLGQPEETRLLMDFAGKYSWVSPEQLAGRDAPIDTRSDLYSLGLVIAAAAHGRRLDMGHDLETARAARRATPPLEVPRSSTITSLLRRLLERDPARRVQTAQEIADMTFDERSRGGLVGRILIRRKRSQSLTLPAAHGIRDLRVDGSVGKDATSSQSLFE